MENQSTSSESDGAQPDSESNSESAVFTDQDKVLSYSQNNKMSIDSLRLPYKL